MVSILLVDDDDQFLPLLSKVLKHAGYQVREATDGQQALRFYESEPTDVVITDLVMPGKEGLEMIVELKRSHPKAKIIAMSGAAQEVLGDYLKMAQAFGAQRVLAKPFSDQEILEAISQVLEE